MDRQVIIHTPTLDRNLRSPKELAPSCRDLARLYYDLQCLRQEVHIAESRAAVESRPLGFAAPYQASRPGPYAVKRDHA
jgi:hypothetical protein